MNTRYLSYIIEIANEKNMRKAAEKLYVSQPSLSQYLTKLEQELGTPLFHRAKGELLPTPVGQMYIDCAQQMLQMKDSLYHDIARLTNSSPINLATSSIWSLKMVSELIPQLKEEFPRISLELVEGNLKPIEELLTERRVDIAFVGINSVEKFKGCNEILGLEEILFAVPSTHPFCLEYPNKKQLTAAELSAVFANEKFILPRKDSTVSIALQDFMKNFNMNTDAVCSVNHMTTVSSMVANKAGVAFIPKTCIQPDAPIAYFCLSPDVYRLSAVLYRSDRPLTIPENRLLEMARDYYSTHFG